MGRLGSPARGVGVREGPGRRPCGARAWSPSPCWRSFADRRRDRCPEGAARASATMCRTSPSRSFGSGL